MQIRVKFQSKFLYLLFASYQLQTGGSSISNLRYVPIIPTDHSAKSTNCAQYKLFIKLERPYQCLIQGHLCVNVVTCGSAILEILIYHSANSIPNTYKSCIWCYCIISVYDCNLTSTLWLYCVDKFELNFLCMVTIVNWELRSFKTNVYMLI